MKKDTSKEEKEKLLELKQQGELERIKYKETLRMFFAKNEIRHEIKSQIGSKINIQLLSRKTHFKPDYVVHIVEELIKEDPRFKKDGNDIFFIEETLPLTEEESRLKVAKDKIGYEIKRKLNSLSSRTTIQELSQKTDLKPDYVVRVVEELIKEDPQFNKYGEYIFFDDKTLPFSKEKVRLSMEKNNLEDEIRRWDRITIQKLRQKTLLKPNYVVYLVEEIMKEDPRFKKEGDFVFFDRTATVTRKEIGKSLEILRCPRCDAPIREEQAEKMLHKKIITCEYCGYVLNKVN